MVQDDELSRLLVMMGLGMIGAPNLAQGVSRGGMFAVQDLGNQRDRKMQQRLYDAKLRDEELQAKQKELALEQAKRLQAIYAGASQPQTQPAGSQRAFADAPGWTPQVPQSKPKDLGQMLLDAGFVKDAKAFAEARGALHGEAYGGLQMTQSGRPYYMTKQGPRYAEDNSFVPREELHFADVGGAIQGLDKFTAAPVGAPVKKGMSAVEADASKRGWLGLQLQRDQFDRGRMVYDPERGGVVNLDTLRFMPATKDGEALPPKMSDKQKNELSDIEAQMAIVRGGIGAAQGTPSAFGLVRGAATLGGTIPESVAGKLDSAEERQARAYVYNITSKVINERAGAAQSAQELARLRSFLPAETDSAEQIVDKFKGFQTYLEELHGARSKPPGTKPAEPAPAKPAAPKAGQEDSGYIFMGGDPADPKNWKKK